MAEPLIKYMEQQVTGMVHVVGDNRNYVHPNVGGSGDAHVTSLVLVGEVTLRWSSLDVGWLRAWLYGKYARPD